MLVVLLLLFGSIAWLVWIVSRASFAATETEGSGWRDLWTLDGDVDRGRYLLLGFSLMAVKYNLERLVAGMMFKRSWSVFAHYLHAPDLDFNKYKGNDASLYSLMILMSFPFIWTGLALTLRRLRSCGLPSWLVILFFVPILNLFFFLAMASLPPAAAASDSARFFDRLIPRSDVGNAALTTGLGGALVLLMAQFSTALLKGYGWGLFIGLPFVLGLISSLLYGHHKRRTLGECVAVAMLSTTFAGVVILAAAVEGVICLAMAAPLGYALALMGALFGYLIQSRSRGEHAAAMLVLVCGVPLLMGAEEFAAERDAVLPVRTMIEVDAPPAAVWRNVVTFSELPAPTHPIFKLGFAYPVRATIAGRGVGAVRRCEFTTGAFVEPITVWDEPKLLMFTVTSQPAPMKESSWYPDLHPAHLDGFLVSEGGQFQLEALPGNRTRLTGTTWYRHEIRPSWYWRPFSDAIIHRIHERVLAHVKALSEAKA
ncbi:MAG: hypothetical protein HY923_00280 [Elusimicrobia bacterium]|nr:hypothetical protein [Elusimicrobiota bacterium]